MAFIIPKDVAEKYKEFLDAVERGDIASQIQCMHKVIDDPTFFGFNSTAAVIMFLTQALGEHERGRVGKKNIEETFFCFLQEFRRETSQAIGQLIAYQPSRADFLQAASPLLVLQPFCHSVVHVAEADSIGEIFDQMGFEQSVRKMAFYMCFREASFDKFSAIFSIFNPQNQDVVDYISLVQKSTKEMDPEDALLELDRIGAIIQHPLFSQRGVVDIHGAQASMKEITHPTIKAFWEKVQLDSVLNTSQIERRPYKI